MSRDQNLDLDLSPNGISRERKTVREDISQDQHNTLRTTPYMKYQHLIHLNKGVQILFFSQNCVPFCTMFSLMSLSHNRTNIDEKFCSGIQLSFFKQLF